MLRLSTLPFAFMCSLTPLPNYLPIRRKYSRLSSPLVLKFLLFASSTLLAIIPVLFELYENKTLILLLLLFSYRKLGNLFIQ
jgi:hypothetical protein